MADPIRVLSLDGGGIRGIVSAVWLAELERPCCQWTRHSSLMMILGMQCDMTSGRKGNLLGNRICTHQADHGPRYDH